MLLIGKIIGTRGLKGELKIYPYTNHPEDFNRIDKVFLKYNINKSLKIKKYTIKKNLLYIFFEGIDNIDKAEELKNTEIFLDKEGEEQFLSDDSFFYKDSIGWLIIDENNNILGRVKDVNTSTLQDIFIVEENGKEWFLPNVKEFIKEIDENNALIRVKLIEGLRDEN